MKNIYIDRIIEAAAEAGESLALKSAGILPAIITLAECKRLYGQSIAQELRITPDINWIPLGKGGKTSGVYTSRDAVTKYMLNRKLKAISR